VMAREPAWAREQCQE
jgi:hypothetical protein